MHQDRLWFFPNFPEMDAWMERKPDRHKVINWLSALVVLNRTNFSVTKNKNQTLVLFEKNKKNFEEIFDKREELFVVVLNVAFL